MSRLLPLSGALALLVAACSAETGSSTSRGEASARAGDPVVYDIPLKTLAGEGTSLADHRGKALLLVNVASECGLTPQYTELEQLQRTYGPRGFSVIGFPCNQFGGQEPGSPQEIQAFCTREYQVSFPLMEKLEVNGSGRHPLYKELTAVPDAGGAAGDVQWNFEKFVVSADGKKIVRFRPRTTPGSPEVIAAIEAALPRR
jgi:glutathione peroxidase